MYTGFLHIHSSLRYPVLGLLLVVIAKSFVNWRQGRLFTNTDKKITLWLMIGTHTQLLTGIFLLFLSPYTRFGSEGMKDATLRYWTVEHWVMMGVVVWLITLVRIIARKPIPDNVKQKRIFIYSSLALAIIFVAIRMSGRAVFPFL